MKRERYKGKLSKGIIDNAVRILHKLYNEKIGSEEEFVVDGKKFVGVLEWHFRKNPDGNKPVGKHKGISVFEIIEDV